MIRKLREKFHDYFDRNEKKVYFFFAPGRISLMGQHLDYNGGYVLPCALSSGTCIVIRKREDQLLKMASINKRGMLSIPIGSFHERAGNEWWNYPLGVIHEFLKIKTIPFGFDILFGGNVVMGAGLSSSASIEMATAYAVNELLQTEFSLRDLALMCKQAENEFVGVQCGYMDQFASAFSLENHAMLLNCHTLTFEFIPINLYDHGFIIVNSNTYRQLDGSLFNVRYSECRWALDVLKKLLQVDELANATPGQFEEAESLFGDEIPRKRAHFIIHENARVQRAARALGAGDVSGLAALMNASHQSLRDDYEVSSFELEAAVKSALGVKGCLASRISGAGFAGCTISLVEISATDRFKEEVYAAYKKQTGLEADFYDVKTGNGVRRILSEREEAEIL